MDQIELETARYNTIYCSVIVRISAGSYFVVGEADVFFIDIRD
jgi:hypothetical protein